MKKYHLIFDKKYFCCAAYLIFYLGAFALIDHFFSPSHYHILTTPLDYMIPFNEWFIFFYYMWFPLMAFSYLFTFFKDQKEYLRLCTFTFTGMTIFIIVSIVYPNGLDLRPAHLANTNIARVLCNLIWSMDSPTNVLPSIHVFNSVGFAIALNKTDHLKKKYKRIASILSALIVICVMPVKQHGIVDVCTALLLALIMYYIVYVKNIYIFKKDYHRRYEH